MHDDSLTILSEYIQYNTIQYNTTGVAVGCGWQAFVAYVNVGCYYIVGIPLGCLLGFYFDLGAAVRTTSLRVAFFSVTLFDTMAAGYNGCRVFGAV
jgi:Na+-driven multidrug efflux pump